ncbi:MAG TPA: hypothetical protein VFT22_43930, partial [Kofleriaceae bacterium]|nr:hypothetical protein [Kofleriaceae bacterium]
MPLSARVLSLVIGVLWLVVPLDASARPRARIAVAPLDGDAGNTIALAVADALAGPDFVVIGPREVAREKARLGMSGELTSRDARKLARKLDAVAILDGKLTRSGARRSLRIEVHRRGRPGAAFTIEFKSSASPAFRRGVHDEVVKKLETGEPETDDADEGDEPAPRPAARTDDGDARKRPLAEDDDARRARPPGESPRRGKPGDGDEDARGRDRAADDTRRAHRGDDEPRRKRTAAASSDDDPAIRKTRRRHADQDAAAQANVRVGGGASLAQRRLTFDTRAGFTQV